MNANEFIVNVLCEDGRQLWECYHVPTGREIASCTVPYEVRMARLPDDHRYGQVIEWGPVGDTSTGMALWGSKVGYFVDVE